MGDVAISAPLVRAYASANSECNFFMVSQPRFEAMFSYPYQQCAKIKSKQREEIESKQERDFSFNQDSTAEFQNIDNKQITVSAIENLHYIPLNTKHGASDYNGSWLQLIKFARTLKKQYGITHFADIHDVLRTKVLRVTLWVLGVKVIKIDKHRKERSALCRQHNKKFSQIIKSQRCMEEVFVKLGLKDLHFSESTIKESFQKSKTDSRVIKIGIAPFAGHKGKEWPAEKMEDVLNYFATLNSSEKEGEKGGVEYKILLYGGGKREIDIMRSWADKYPNTELFAGKHSLYEELESMSSLDFMISMDSANMHLASLVGTSVICIWGATHRYAGYNGWGQKDSNAVEVELPCRPCSIFGAKKCINPTPYACLNMVTPQMVISKIVHECSNG